MRVNQLWADNFSMIDTKHGAIRSKLLGGEWNYSGRQVIVLDPSLKINEVDVPYKAFIEQFKEHILHYIIKDKGWTITKALNYLTSKFNYDPYVYSVMQHIVTENECRMIINRNPKHCGVVKDI